MPDPRRRYPRGTLRGVAQISGAFGRATGELRELSLGGAFIAGVRPLPPASLVKIHLLLPHSVTPLEANGTVLYERLASERCVGGLGVAFESLDEEDMIRVQSAVLECDAKMTELLFRLQKGMLPRAELDAACREAGIPTGLDRNEVARCVEEAIRRFHGVA